MLFLHHIFFFFFFVSIPFCIQSPFFSCCLLCFPLLSLFRGLVPSFAFFSCVAFFLFFFFFFFFFFFSSFFLKNNSLWCWQSSMELIVERESQLGTLSLHPLVLINISDSWTRARIKSKEANPRVIGCLMGVQRGRDVEIFNSFELVHSVNEQGKVEIDQTFLTTRKELFAQPYPTYDILGYYLTTSGLTPAGIAAKESNCLFSCFFFFPLRFGVERAVSRGRRVSFGSRFGSSQGCSHRQAPPC